MTDDTTADDGGFEWGTVRDDTPDRDDPSDEGRVTDDDVPSDEAARGSTGEVDEDVRETVERELADVADDDQEYPTSDDPVTPQRIDAENAAFVVLGVLAMVGLVAFLVLSV